MRQEIDRLIELWLNDTDFRVRFSTNPQMAVESVGIALSDEEWLAINDFDFSLSALFKIGSIPLPQAGGC